MTPEHNTMAQKSTMTKADLAKELHSKLGAYSIRQCNAIVHDILDLIIEALVNRQEVKLRNFGTFKVRLKPQRRGCSPVTHEHIIVPARYIVVFKASKKLRALLNEKSNE